MGVGFAVLVEVEDLPDAIAVEDEEILAASDDGHGFMETGGVAFPSDLSEVVMEAGDEPDVAIEGDGGGVTLVIKKGEVSETEFAVPWVGG